MDSYIGTLLPFAGSWAPVGYALALGQLVSASQYLALLAIMGNTYGGDGRTTIGLPNLGGRTPVGLGTLPGSTQSLYLGEKLGTATTILTQAQLPAHTHTATFNATYTSPSVPVPPVNGTGSLTASVAVPVSTAGSTTTAVANHTDLTLAGMTVGTAKGPYVTTGPTANTTLVPFNAPVTASSDYKPTIPAQNITIPNMISGGTVNVSVAGASNAVSLLQPSLVINFLFCLQGIWPDHP